MYGMVRYVMEKTAWRFSTYNEEGKSFPWSHAFRSHY